MGCKLLIYFLGLRYFQGGVEKFSEGGGGGVKIFRGEGGLINFRGGGAYLRGGLGGSTPRNF